MKRVIVVAGVLLAAAVVHGSAGAAPPDDSAARVAQRAFEAAADAAGNPVTHPACAVYDDGDEVRAQCYGLLSTGETFTAAGRFRDGSVVFDDVPPATLPPEATGAGTRDDPIPLGVAADIGDGWSLVVNEVIDDAWSEIQAANMFNDPPPEGSVYVMVNITTAYNGPSEKDDGFWINPSGVTSSNVELTTYDHVVVPPDEYDGFAEVFQGGSKSGNIVFTVPADEVETLVIYANARLMGGRDVYFATR